MQRFNNQFQNRTNSYLPQTNKKSYISDNFYGQYLKSFTCQLCGNCYYK